jgi:hypothetical protein
VKLFCMLFCVQDLYQHISFHSEQHKERITMSSSEDEEGNEKAKVLLRLLIRSCKELIATSSESETPRPNNLEAKGLWIYSSMYASSFRYRRFIDN